MADGRPILGATHKAAVILSGWLLIAVTCGAGELKAQCPDPDCATPPPCRLHVKQGATGTGTCWADAIGELTDAFGEALTRNTDPDPANDVSEIWVATGTYRLSNTCVTDRTASFRLVDGVKVYGGFQGNEACLAERAGLFDQTILSGDIYTLDQVACCPVAVAVDSRPGQRKVYWTDDRQMKIWRADMDGPDRNVTELVARLFENLMPPPILFRIALDTDGGKMYWAEVGRGLIMRANLDGSLVG